MLDIFFIYLLAICASSKKWLFISVDCILYWGIVYYTLDINSLPGLITLNYLWFRYFMKDMQITDKHIRIYLTSIIREIQQATTIHSWQVGRATLPLILHFWKYKLTNPLWKRIHFLKIKFNLHSPSDSPIPLVHNLSRRNEAVPHTVLYTIFIEIYLYWLKFSSTSERISKLCCHLTMDYYSEIWRTSTDIRNDTSKF